MERTLVVKGEGKSSVRPDCIEINLDLLSFNYKYGEAMELSFKRVNSLYTALENAGIKKTDVKTISYNVSAKHDSIRDNNGNYTYKFKRYEVLQKLRVSIDLDINYLSRLLSAVAESNTDPKIDLAFTVKDDSIVKEELLRSAAKNARLNASILADASGVELGDIIKIDYNWSDMVLKSDTLFDCLTSYPKMSASSIDIEPDEIKVSDSVTFVWEIKGNK